MTPSSQGTERTMKTLVLDLGSHSAKAYLKGDDLLEVGAVTWTLLEGAPSEVAIDSAIRQLVAPHRQSCQKVIAVGTEAMRRSSQLAHQIQSVCQGLDIGYRTISHEEEAALIRLAFPEGEESDIVNAGGGSIQIILSREQGTALLGFGISDLNRMFDLNGAPELRRLADCIDWVAAQLPDGLSDFAYTGGEETYLRHMGVPLFNGRCLADDFVRSAERIGRLSLVELEALSPRDAKWMHGANASNCIVRACLRKANATSFRPTDINIAHGLLRNVVVDA